jgi:hypothetical protein
MFFLTNTKYQRAWSSCNILDLHLDGVLFEFWQDTRNPDVYHGSPHSFHVSAGILPQVCHGHFHILRNSLSIYHHTIQRYKVSSPENVTEQ